RRHVVVVEAVPAVVGRPQRQVFVTADFGVVLVVALHDLPLAVVDPLGHAAAAVHGDDQRPTLVRLLADLAHHVGADVLLVAHLFVLEILFHFVVHRRRLVRLPDGGAHRRV